MTGNTMSHVKNHLFSRNHAETDHWMGSINDMRLYRSFGILIHEVGQVSIFERCIECSEMTWIADFDKPGLHYWFERQSGKRAKEIETLIDTLRPVADHDRDYRGFHDYKVAEKTHGLVEHRGVAYWIEGAIISTTFGDTKQAYKVHMYTRCGYCDERHSLHEEMVGAIYQIVDTRDPDFYRYQHLDGTDDFALRYSTEDMATMIDYVIDNYLSDEYSLAVYAQVYHSEVTMPDDYVAPVGVVYGKAVYHDLTSHVGQSIDGEYFRHRNVAYWTDQINDSPIKMATHLLARCGTCGEWIDLDQFEITNLHGGDEYKLAPTDAHGVTTSADNIRALIEWIIVEELSTRGYRALFPDIDRSPTEVKVLRGDDTTTVKSYMVTAFGYSTIALGSSLRVAVNRGIESVLNEQPARDTQRQALATGSEVVIKCRIMSEDQVTAFEKSLKRYHDKLDRLAEIDALEIKQ